MKQSSDHILYERLPKSNKTRYWGTIRDQVVYRGVMGFTTSYLIPDYIFQEILQTDATTIRLMDSGKHSTYYESSVSDWQKRDNMFWLSRAKMMKIYYYQEKRMRKTYSIPWYLR